MKDVSELLSKDIKTLRGWTRVYRAGGLSELLRRIPGHNGQGQPSFLTAEQIAQVQAHARTTGFVGTADARDWIAEQFGVEYEVQSIQSLFRRNGIRWKVPRPRHEKQSEGAVEAFKKGGLPPRSPKRVWSLVRS